MKSDPRLTSDPNPLQVKGDPRLTSDPNTLQVKGDPSLTSDLNPLQMKGAMGKLMATKKNKNKKRDKKEGQFLWVQP